MNKKREKGEEKVEEKVKERKEPEKIIRIMQTDIAGDKQLYVGLTKIKGVSWSLSNGICKILKIDKNRRIGSLTDQEITKISEFIKNQKFQHIYLIEEGILIVGKTNIWL